MPELEKVVKENLEKILFFIGVMASIDVVKDILEEDTYHVNLSGDDLGVVIGYHGEGLASIQHLLSIIVSKKLGYWPRLIVDVNGYRKEREQKVIEMARGAVDRVRFSQHPVELPPMVAFDRRVAHMEVSRNEDVESESVGQGYNRRVLVRLKGAGSSTEPTSKD